MHPNGEYACPMVDGDQDAAMDVSGLSDQGDDEQEAPPKYGKSEHLNPTCSKSEYLRSSGFSVSVPVIVTICPGINLINLIFNNNMNKHHMYFLFFQSCICVMF